MLDKRVVQGIAIAITSVWAVSFLADIVLGDYQPSPFVHAIMMILAGALFGGTAFNNGKKNGS